MEFDVIFPLINESEFPVLILICVDGSIIPFVYLDIPWSNPGGLSSTSTYTRAFPNIFGEPDVKGGGRRILSATMTSTSRIKGQELTKGMVSIVEFMLKAGDRETLIDKAVDQTMEIAG